MCARVHACKRNATSWCQTDGRAAAIQDERARHVVLKRICLWSDCCEVFSAAFWLAAWILRGKGRLPLARRDRTAEFGRITGVFVCVCFQCFATCFREQDQIGSQAWAIWPREGEGWSGEGRGVWGVWMTHFPLGLLQASQT